MSFKTTHYIIRNKRFDIPYYSININSDNGLECSICLEKFDSNCIALYSCDHIYHEKCIREWIKKSRLCPLCRSNIDNINECSGCSGCICF